MCLSSLPPRGDEGVGIVCAWCLEQGNTLSAGGLALGHIFPGAHSRGSPEGRAYCSARGFCNSCSSYRSPTTCLPGITMPHTKSSLGLCGGHPSPAYLRWNSTSFHRHLTIYHLDGTSRPFQSPLRLSYLVVLWISAARLSSAVATIVSMCDSTVGLVCLHWF